jgi:hypothetical protein
VKATHVVRHTPAMAEGVRCHGVALREQAESKFSSGVAVEIVAR